MNKTETLTITMPQALMNSVRQMAPPQQFILEAVEFYLQYKTSVEDETLTAEFVEELEQAKATVAGGDYINFEDIRRDV